MSTKGKALGEMLGSCLEKLETCQTRTENRLCDTKAELSYRIDNWIEAHERSFRDLTLVSSVAPVGTVAACVMAAVALVK